MYSLVLLIPFSILLIMASLVYFYMFQRRREKELEYFGIAWLVYMVSLIFLLLNLFTGRAFFLELRKLVDLANILMLMFGMYRFIRLRIPAYWFRFSIYLLLLSVICMMYRFELICFYLPITIFQIAATIVSCHLITRSILIRQTERVITCLAFFLWGAGNAVASIFELYVKNPYPIHISQLILFTLFNFSLLAVYVEIGSMDTRHKSKLYENVVNSLREIVFYYELSPLRRFQYISPSVETLTGYPQQAFYKDPNLLLDLVEPEQMDTIRELLNGMLPATQKHTLRLIPKNGAPFWCQMNMVVIRNEKEAPVAIECELQDINEIQSSQLKQVQDKEERDRLLSYVSHELRTPITSIAGYTTAIKDGILHEPEDIQEAMDIIADKTATLKTLIDDLGQLSKLETGQFSFDFMILPVREMAEKFAALYTPEIRAGGYIPEVIGLEKLPEDAMVVADEERISQVISNLISNAVKYSFPSTYISLIFSVDRTKDTFLVQVHDEGPGVSYADSLHLFERFYRSKATSVTRSGRGLGLTLSREIINAHKGRIWGYNNKDRGCTFSFSLPLYKENLNV